jgi:hypothetical protein
MSNVIEQMLEEKQILISDPSLDKDQKNIAIARLHGATKCVKSYLSEILRFEESIQYVVNEQSFTLLNNILLEKHERQLVKKSGKREFQGFHLEEGKNHIICRSGGKLFVDNEEVIDLNNRESILSWPFICFPGSSVPLITCIFVGFPSALE